MAGTLAGMLASILPVLVAPGLVAVATLVARRRDHRIGGVVSAFPAIVGPVLLIVAADHGAAFAARAAGGTLLGLVALSGFALAYGRAATRRTWPASLAIGWFVAAVVGTLVARVDAPGPVVAAAAAAASLAFAYRALGGAGARAPAPAPRVAPPSGPAPAWDLPFRMATTAALVAVLPALATLHGPVAGGVLAALPVLASVLAVFTQAQAGPAAAVAFLRGMLAGMGSFVVFCVLVAALVEDAGVLAAFALATAAAVAVQVFVAMRARQPTPA